MRDETALGWYDFRGVACISLASASNAESFAEVANHEHSHHLLATQSPFGLAQLALSLARDTISGLNEGRTLELEAICSALDDVSRFAQEAVATYSSLALSAESRRQSAHEFLPVDYYSGYELFDRLLGGRDFDAKTKMRLSRQIGIRAFQTSLLSSVEPQSLIHAAFYSQHLRDARNRPNDRLDMLAEALDRFDDAKLLEWAGRLVVNKEGLLIALPVAPESIVGLDFFSVYLGDGPRRLIELVKAVGGDEAAAEYFTYLGSPFEFKAVLAPLQFDVHVQPDEPINTETDLAILAINGSSKPIVDAWIDGAPRVIEGEGCEISTFQPDRSVAQVTYRSIGEAGDYLGAAGSFPVLLKTDWLLTLAACLDKHTDAERPFDALELVRKWIPSERIILWTAGWTHGLKHVLDLKKATNDDAGWLAFGYLMNSLWGYVLLRPRGDTWPLVLHPAFLSEWNKDLGSLGPSYHISVAQSPEEFFGQDRARASVGYLYMRVHLGQVYRPDQWGKLLANMLNATFRDSTYVQVTDVIRDREEQWPVED